MCWNLRHRPIFGRWVLIKRNNLVVNCNLVCGNFLFTIFFSIIRGPWDVSWFWYIILVHHLKRVTNIFWLFLIIKQRKNLFVIVFFYIRRVWYIVFFISLCLNSFRSKVFWLFHFCDTLFIILVILRNNNFRCFISFSR